MIKSVSKIRFKAKLLQPLKSAKLGSSTLLILPKEASKKLPSRGQTAVEGTINDSPFQAVLQPDGQGSHWLTVSPKMSNAANAKLGDTVSLVIAPARQEPEPTVPTDLRKALAATPKALETWSDITPVARRDWIQWMSSGKQAETRALRIKKMCDMLSKGKRRICCFDRSGMYDKSMSCPVADEKS